jgi:alpha-tubulin suppressor-like RCC1 family protein
MLFKDVFLGQQVLVRGQTIGWVRFKGHVHNESGEWVGVELDRPHGRHNGTVIDIEYFHCRDNYGDLVRSSQIEPLLHDTVLDASVAATAALDSTTIALHSPRCKTNTLSRNGRSRSKTSSSTTITGPGQRMRLQSIDTKSADSNSASMRPSSSSSSSSAAAVAPGPLPHSEAASTDCESDNDIEVYVWGDNTSGELGIGVLPDLHCQDMASGMSLNESKQAQKSRHRKTRSGTTTSASDIVSWPTPMKLPEAERSLNTMAFGLHHMVAVGESNRIYGCGSSLSERLGSKSFGDSPTVPLLTPLKLAAKPRALPDEDNLRAQHTSAVAHVRCGDHHSIMVSTDGSVLTWGGSLHGKLGRPQSNNSTNSSSNGMKHNSTGEDLQVWGLRDKEVKQVDCGTFHSITLTANGELYTFGGGGRHHNYGQIGQGDTIECAVPRLIEPLHGVFIEQVACGSFHTLVRSNEGLVYSWGRGEFGQLGLGTLSNQNTPRLLRTLIDKNVNFDDPVSVIPLSPRQAASGAFTYPTQATASSPNETHRAHRGQQYAVSIACGDNHSMILTENGDVFTFGYGQSGQLGHGYNRNEKVPRLVCALCPHGESREVERRNTIVQIAAGWRHSLALTHNGQVYAWGNGSKGELGSGTLHSTNIPRAVEKLARVIIRQIAAGGAHSAASTASFTDGRHSGRLEERLQQLSMESKQPSSVSLASSAMSATSTEAAAMAGSPSFWDTTHSQSTNRRAKKLHSTQWPDEKQQLHFKRRHVRATEAHGKSRAAADPRTCGSVQPVGSMPSMFSSSKLSLIHRYITFEKENMTENEVAIYVRPYIERMDPIFTHVVAGSSDSESDATGADALHTVLVICDPAVDDEESFTIADAHKVSPDLPAWVSMFEFVAGPVLSYREILPYADSYIQ